MSKMTKTIAALGVVAGLGVAALPLSSYAVASDTVNVTAQAIVGDSISITADASDKTVTISDVTANQAVKEGSTILTVTTNNASGYKVTIADTDPVTALTADGADAEHGIPASGTLTQNSKGWGFKTSSTTEGVTVSSAQQGYRAVTEDPLTIATRSGSASAEGGDKINLTFGVVVDTSIAPGTYSDEVVLTATTAN